jgi:hypothetical protein
MHARLLIAACLAFALAASSAGARSLLHEPGNSPVLKVQRCGWFAIYSCSRDWGEARAAASAEGGRVLDSSSPEFPNFRPGWYCAAFGPMSYDEALSIRNSLLRQYPTAYAKSSC